MNKKKQIIASIVAVLLLVLLTIGVTYAVFTYTKLGTTENTVTAGTLKFLYTENTGVGAGIALTDALPVSDTVGKSYSTEGKVFDFSIEATNTGTEVIPYEITLRKKDTSTLGEEAVKVYLTDMTEDADSEILEPTLYSNLAQTNIDVGEEVEKTIHTDSVAGGELTYLKDYRLRMWVAEETDFSTGNYNGKTFIATVNVYSNVPLVSEEEMNERSNAEISKVTASDTELTVVENEAYQYEISLPKDTTETTIIVETENPNSTVVIEKLDSLAYTDSKIKRTAISNKVSLNSGDNYFKVTIISENKVVKKSYILRIFVSSSISGESIFSIIEENDLKSGNYIFEVNGENYPVHLYAFEGNQTWSENQKFGNDNDVATATTEAQNMVVVKVNGDLTINSGVKVEPWYTNYGGPKGLTLYVTGTLTNNGTIDNSHGAKAVGQNVYLWKNTDGTYEYVPATGATGGAGAYNAAGITGNPGSGRQTGGGGSGGTYYATTGVGGTGTSYSGGAGSGGVYSVSRGSAAGSSIGGAGSAGIRDSSTDRAGGGAGNPGGSGDAAGGNGTGGLLAIYANNYVNNGTISANGTTGGDIQWGGGSSGAGSINIFYSSNVTKGTTQVLGGSSVGTRKGGAGGAGTVTYTQITK